MALGPCRECGREVSDQAATCPSCGTPAPVAPRGGDSPVPARSQPSEPQKRRRKAPLLALILVLLAAGAAGLFLKKQHDDKIAADKVVAAAAQQRIVDAAALKHAEAVAKQKADHDKRADRAELVRLLEADIKKDANVRIGKSEIAGPRVTEAICTPLGGGSQDDLTAITGQFTCTAVNENLKDGGQRGYAFSATINYSKSTWEWQLGRG